MKSPSAGRGVAVRVLLLTALGSGLATLLDVSWGLWAEREAGPSVASLEAWVGAATGISATALLAWAWLVVATDLLAVLPGTAGVLAARTARAITPAALRTLLIAAVGTSTACAIPQAGDPGTVPVLMRPVTSQMTGTFAPSTEGREARVDVGSQESPRAGHTRLEPPRAGHTRQESAPSPRHGEPSDAAGGQPREAESAATVVVQPGDTLWAIAARALPEGSNAAAVARTWPRWFQANRQVIGPDPDSIVPGTVLTRPDHAGNPTSRSSS